MRPRRVARRVQGEWGIEDRRTRWQLLETIDAAVSLRMLSAHRFERQIRDPGGSIRFGNVSRGCRTFARAQFALFGAAAYFGSAASSVFRRPSRTGRPGTYQLPAALLLAENL